MTLMHREKWGGLSNYIQPVYSTENLLDFEERIFQCFEMQLVDTDFEEAYVPEPKAYREYIPPKSIPDSVFFEFVYGEWVCKNLANLYIHDLKLRNIGLKKVDLKRFYHFGEVTYCFEPGFMPMRLDLNAFDELELKDNYNKNNLTVQIKFIQRFLAPKSMAEEFSREYLNDPEKGIFFYFERYFKGSQVKVSCDALGIHYYKPEV